VAKNWEEYSSFCGWVGVASLAAVQCTFKYNLDVVDVLNSMKLSFGPVNMHRGKEI
jgi:hypothetical protein